MGLYPAAVSFSLPGFGIGTTLAVFHSLGNLPLEIDRLISLEMIGAVLSAVCFSILANMPSQPVNFVVSSRASKSNTDASVDRSYSGQSSGGISHSKL